MRWGSCSAGTTLDHEKCHCRHHRTSLLLHRERMRRLAGLLQHSLWKTKVSEGTRAAVLETLGCILEAAPQVSGLPPFCIRAQHVAMQTMQKRCH